MSLLLEIQDAAVGTDTPLPVLLRKCQILAARLGHDPLRDWALSEVEGYRSTDKLPDYRKTGPLEAYGSFMQDGIKLWPRLPIPRSVIPSERHERLFAHQFLQGVAELEPLAAAAPDTSYSIDWPNDAIAIYGEGIWRDMICLKAHVDITPHIIAGVLDTVRNRVLMFALEIWKEAPDAGEAPAAGQFDVAPQRIEGIFNTYVLGPVGALAVGGSQTVDEVNVTVTPGDVDSLRAVLSGLGIAPSDVRDLDQALATDATSPSATGSLGPATATWIERFGGEVTNQGVALANCVTAGLLTELLVRFLSG